MSMYEIAEPDWSCTDNSTFVTFKELKFDLDDELQKEIERTKLDCDRRVASYKFFNSHELIYINTLTSELI